MAHRGDRQGRMAFLAIAIVFHLIYIFSIFDIYFVSPIVSGMGEYEVKREGEAPARRLVLFVGDGLRADKAFQAHSDPSPPPGTDPSIAAKPRHLAPFLRSRVLEHGTFGVSHTRVPTESRPGHVALIAGLYEDVSAVTTGWKLNPVNFDSVLNKSRHSWCWGSPDIVPMFVEGAVPGRVEGDCYGAEMEDFSQDALILDTWVFDRVKKLFEDARTNATLAQELSQDKIVFFLHLLGLDTTGHTFRPYSKEYLHNIKVVDEGVKEMTELIEEYYGDQKTAYVFTADHGMSDWGSHGDGHPDNTRTPLIAWGSGVAKPIIKKKGEATGHEDGFSSDWALGHVQRNDVAQADVAALMAYLAGLPFPVNSVGELPLEYLDASPEEKAEALLVNAIEILEMYRVKEIEKKGTLIRYKPFPGFANEERSISHHVDAIRQMIREGKSEEAIASGKYLIQLGLAGLRYLQTYDWLFLRALVTVGYLGWIVFAITTVITRHVLGGQSKPQRTAATVVGFSSIAVVLFSVLFVQKSPWTYYAYAVFPVMFWEEVFARRNALAEGRKALMGHLKTTPAWIGFVCKSLAFFAVLEALVQSYFHRQVFTACYILAMSWPFFYGLSFVKDNWVLVATWALACAAMSAFTLFPAIKVENLEMVLVGGVLMFLVGLLYLLFEKSILVSSTSGSKLAENKSDSLSRSVLGVQIGLILLSMLTTRSSVLSLQRREGLPLGAQMVGWTVLVLSLTIPFLHGLQPNGHYLHRLVVIFLSFAPLFVILTISYEGLFYLAFSITLVTWVRLEHRVHVNATTYNPSSTAANTPAPTLNPGEHRPITLSDFRISLFFLYLLQSGFFSTGNIASVSSFSLDAVYRLLPVFDPFSQGALLMLKLLIPFALISANLGILNLRLGLEAGALFGVVAALGDVLTMNFFWMVRDEGSWLEIGMTISHFVIASLLSVFVAALESLSEIFVGGIEFGDIEKKAHEVAESVIPDGNISSTNNRTILANGPIDT